ncbi:MAG TPA: universal stress protein [Planctomycetota bacterium]|nr:universal stress protein [Planctomycetota bacterium]
MFERILVPLDGSPLGEAVFTQIRRILFRKDAEILLVQAVSVPPSLEGMSEELPVLLRVQARVYLQRMEKLFFDQGARVRSIVRTGEAADVILDVADQERATLIAMSTHGRTGLSRWALGSVTERVLQASRVPVLAVRSFEESGRQASPAELGLEKILVPVDSTAMTLEVIGPTVELAQMFGSKVALLHVCQGEACAIPVPELTCAYDQFRAGGIALEPLLKEGDPAQQILETCREQQAGLIAMTTHGRIGVGRWLMGSVTEKVLRAARVPLLIVRPAVLASARTVGAAKEHVLGI